MRRITPIIRQTAKLKIMRLMMIVMMPHRRKRKPPQHLRLKHLAVLANHQGLYKAVDGREVISEFGNDKNGSFNDGISIQAPEGTPVKAAGGGTVVYSGNQLQGYGNMIIIKHPNFGYLSAYSAFEKELELKKGETVGQGGGRCCRPCRQNQQY